MVSKTRMIALVREHHAKEVELALADSPALLAYRDDRGRSWRHVCCMAKPRKNIAERLASRLSARHAHRER